MRFAPEAAAQGGRRTAALALAQGPGVDRGSDRRPGSGQRLRSTAIEGPWYYGRNCPGASRPRSRHVARRMGSTITPLLRFVLDGSLGCFPAW